MYVCMYVCKLMMYAYICMYASMYACIQICIQVCMYVCKCMYVCMYVWQASDWEPERKKIEMKKPFCLRVFIYQCKDLPAVDDNYLIDPYIKVCMYVNRF